MIKLLNTKLNCLMFAQKMVGASFLLFYVGVLFIIMSTFTVAVAKEGSAIPLNLLKAVQQNGTIKPGPKQDRPWLPSTGGLTPRGTREVVTKGVEQHRRRLSQPFMYKTSVVNIRINMSEPTTFFADDVIATYSPIRLHADKQHQMAKHYNDCVWPSHWFSVLNPKLPLPVFTSIRQLKMYPDWEKYLMSVYGNSLTFPLDTRGFTFFWKHNFATPPNAVLNFIKSHGGDRNVNLKLSRNARMGEFMSLSFQRATTNSPEILHVYGDKDGAKQGLPGPFMRLHPTGFPSHSKVEVYHDCCDYVATFGLWFFLAPGSGVSIDLGKTISFFTHVEGCVYFHIKKMIRQTLAANHGNVTASFQWWSRASEMLDNYRQHALSNSIAHSTPFVMGLTGGPIVMGLTGDPVLFPSAPSNWSPFQNPKGIDGRIIDSFDTCFVENGTVHKEARRAGYDTIQYMNHYIGGGSSVYEVVDLRGRTNNKKCPSPEIQHFYHSGSGGTKTCTCLPQSTVRPQITFECAEQFVPANVNGATAKAAAAAAAASASAATTARIEKLTIVFTGDVHGYISNSLNLARTIEDIRKTNGRNHTLLLDAGDGFVGSRFFSYFGPTGIAEEMQQLEYDAMALGNHDFEYKNELAHFVNTSKTPMVSANVPNVTGITEYTIVNKGIFRIGITAYSALDVEHPGYIPPKHVDLLIKKLTSVATHLREVEGCNVLILLGHGGIAVDFEIAQHRLFDAILGGHSHVSYSQPQGYVRNQPIVVHSGAYLDQIGVLSLEFTIADVCGETDVPDLSNSFSYLVNVNAMENNASAVAIYTSPATTKFESWLKQKFSQLNATDADALSVVVGNVHSLAASRGIRVPTKSPFGKVVASNRVCRYGECILGYLVAKLMRGSYFCQLQHPFWNYTSDVNVSLLSIVSLREAGSIRANLMEGKLREADLHEMFPWNNKLHAIQVPGTIVRRMIEHGISTGKDGTGGGTLSSSGLMYAVNDTAPLGQRVGTIYVQEKCSTINQCYEIIYENTITIGKPILYSSPCNNTISWRVLEPEDMVLCVVTEWILNGGDGFDFLQASDARRVAHSAAGEIEMFINLLNLRPFTVSPKLVEKKFNKSTIKIEINVNSTIGLESPNSTIGLESPPILIIILIQLVSFSANILNHRATRVLFDGNSIEVSLANSFISMVMIMIICGALEIYYYNTEIHSGSVFQGPMWVTAAIIANPVMLLNGFSEIGYTCGTAAIYKSSIGIVLKVLAAFVAALGTKVLLPVFGLKESHIPTTMYVAAVFLALPGVYFSLTEKDIFGCYHCKKGYVKVEKGYGEVETDECLSLLEAEDMTDGEVETDDIDTNMSERKVKSIKVITVPLVVGVGFFVLIVAHTFWTLFQVVFAHEFGINSTGYISLDQVYGSIFTMAFTAISTCIPMTRGWTQNRRAGELFSTVVQKTFGSIFTSPSAFLYLTIAKITSNGMIIAYFVLSTKYDPGMVVLQMSLTKVMIGVVYTIVVALCFPNFLAMSQEEIDGITSCSQIVKRLIGVIFIMSGLYVIYEPASKPPNGSRTFFVNVG